ncbi:MAG: SDR family oxidoreductase [Armatimonadetes bacterium]|nr:SDR family oxidoreductase [Armatimonadota bacterium]
MTPTSAAPGQQDCAVDCTDEDWALILGGSSGFGLAAAKKLASQGMSVCVVHRDRRGAMPKIDAQFESIRGHGHGFLSFNLDALSADGMAAVIGALKDRAVRIRLVLHSLAYGNLKPIAPSPTALTATSLLDDEDLARTIHSMGTSLLSWVQAIHRNGLFGPDARVLGLTSEGNTVAWPGYAAVAAAKGALECLSRAIAVEYAPYGVRCNILQPGVTDTPALRLIPGNEKMRAVAIQKNPYGRLTTVEDVADVISLLCRDEARWINGALIRVDGGEHIGSL